MHGAKDKFNAKSLLSTPIDEIPVSDEEEEETKDKREKPDQEEVLSEKTNELTLIEEMKESPSPHKDKLFAREKLDRQ